ncbi:MAG TPA: TIM barrel protein [Nanoarchaeota archaeon]|nr:TIM barrel protein [Nanoarchaeota archaeon]
MKIGISTVCLPPTNWIACLKHMNIDAVEINPKSYLPYKYDKLQKYTSLLSKWSLSIHTHGRPLFSKNEIFDNRSIAILKSEIFAANILAGREVVFHLPRSLPMVDFNETEFNHMHNLLEFANANSVQLFLENNSGKAWSNWPELKEMLNLFPSLGFCLDVAHLRCATVNSSEITINDFIQQLGDRVTYAHAHNSYGPIDSHSAIDNGSLDVITNLRKLPHLKKIIVESTSFEDALRSADILKESWE